MNQAYPVTVAAAPVFDPEHTRMKGIATWDPAVVRRKGFGISE